jgi:hypothetical protein
MAAGVRLLAVTLATVALGCAPPPAKTPPSPPSPPITTTSAPGELRILDLVDGQDAIMVAGAQGGFHVWMQYAVRDVGGSLALERSAYRASDGAVVLRYRGQVDIGAPDADDWWTAPAPIPMFMCPSPIGISIVDVPIEFQLRMLGDGDVELARATITLVPRCPDGQLDFCTRICTG